MLFRSPSRKGYIRRVVARASTTFLKIFEGCRPRLPGGMRSRPLGQSCSHGEHIKCSPAHAELAIDFACRRAAGVDVRFKIVKKAVDAQCADRRYMGSDIFYQLGPLTRLGDLLACRCRRLDRQGFLRGQSRLLWLHLRASPWRLSCGLRRRCGRCRRRSSS